MALYILYKKVCAQNGFCKTCIDSEDLCITLAATISLTLISGIGGFAFQTMDYWCHNAKFQELLQNEWPLRFPADRPVMAYYFGYYLVPAAFSKLSGEVSAAAIMIWTGVGIMLGLLWLYIALCRKWWAMLLVLCVGDFPRFFKGIAANWSFPLYRYEEIGVEHWSNFENLFWAPNQFIPSLILGGMLFYVIRHRLDVALLCFPTVLSLWWAAFPALVVGLLAALLLVAQWIRWGATYRQLWGDVLLPLVAALPVMLLFQSHPQPPENGFIWTFRSDAANLLREYLTNTVADVLLFAAAFLVFRRAGFSNASTGPFWLLVGITMLFPLVRVGKVNDMLLRGMMPVLLLIGCYLLYPLAREPWPKVVAAFKGNMACMMIGLALLLQAVVGMGRLHRAARFNRITALWSPAESRFVPIPYNAYPSLYETLRQRWSQQEAEQYLGKTGSFYEKYIAPPPE
ncbi:hypothetical protein GCM10010967_58210 [Dyadobacter beijingensis]|uniref:Uncharacterized protein n=2 Tax=Dyadobacter beijingensis TaxID=365489 RepID=A0ABQ2IJQ0_9BACT|nr:hypothetical protein [Dyadobacter beijingensis]GGN14293.1 hypothetical protein GCM10010967_58210 [Dyadobacter beijingensis]